LSFEGAHHRYMFKAKVPVSKVIWCLSLLNDNNVFDADPVASVGIVARFLARMLARSLHYSVHSPFETVMPGFKEVLLYAGAVGK